MTLEEYNDLLTNESFCADIQNFLNGTNKFTDCHVHDKARDILHSEFYNEFMERKF